MSEPLDTSLSTIVNTTAGAFERDVLGRSRVCPVVVDFWAAWCAPCRILGPVLEQLAQEYGGRFVLVKADTDQVPVAAQQFGVQSIPAVFGVVDGEIVDFFVGALPEQQIRTWLERLLVTGDLAAAQHLETVDAAHAEAQYRRVLGARPNEAMASIGLARVLLAQGRTEETRSLIEQLERRGFLEPEAEKIKAALGLSGRKTGELAACRAAVAADPNNLQVQLAEALAGAEQHQEALDICLALVERDRHGVGEVARRFMVDLFRVLPDGSELVATYRRRLAMLLY
jgi:putative thioredoxin